MSSRSSSAAVREGWGKTTTSAAIALHAARLGRTACVVTIDPARRLANSLGVDELSNRPTRIEGEWTGELYALMLDPKGTFDDLISRYSDSEAQAEDIRVNRIYRNLTGTLSGTQEYMAMEKLYELVEEGGFDIVVVDTPPSRNALDFLDAPRRLTHFLENRVFQAVMAPTSRRPKPFTVHFVAQFNRPMTQFGAWRGGQPLAGRLAVPTQFEALPAPLPERDISRVWAETVDRLNTDANLSYEEG